MNRHFQIMASLVSLVAIIFAAWLHRTYFAQPVHAAQIEQDSNNHAHTKWNTEKDHSKPSIIENFGDQESSNDDKFPLALETQGFDGDDAHWPITEAKQDQQVSSPPAIDSKYRPLIPFRNRSSNIQPRGEHVTLDTQIRNQRVSRRQTISYTTKKGDTLPKLAERFLGSADRYLELYAMNMDRLPNVATVPEDVLLMVPVSQSDNRGIVNNDNLQNSTAMHRVKEID